MRKFLSRFMVMTIAGALVVDPSMAQGLSSGMSMAFPGSSISLSLRATFTTQALSPLVAFVERTPAKSVMHSITQMLRVRLVWTQLAGSAGGMSAPVLIRVAKSTAEPTSLGHVKERAVPWRPNFWQISAVVAIGLAASYIFLPGLAHSLQAFGLSSNLPFPALRTSVFGTVSWFISEWVAVTTVKLLALSLTGIAAHQIFKDTLVGKGIATAFHHWEDYTKALKKRSPTIPLPLFWVRWTIGSLLFLPVTIPHLLYDFGGKPMIRLMRMSYTGVLPENANKVETFYFKTHNTFWLAPLLLLPFFGAASAILPRLRLLLYRAAAHSVLVSAFAGIFVIAALILGADPVHSLAWVSHLETINLLPSILRLFHAQSLLSVLTAPGNLLGQAIVNLFSLFGIMVTFVLSWMMGWPARMRYQWNRSASLTQGSPARTFDLRRLTTVVRKSMYIMPIMDAQGRSSEINAFSSWGGFVAFVKQLIQTQALMMHIVGVEVALLKVGSSFASSAHAVTMLVEDKVMNGGEEFSAHLLHPLGMDLGDITRYMPGTGGLSEREIAQIDHEETLIRDLEAHQDPLAKLAREHSILTRVAKGHWHSLPYDIANGAAEIAMGLIDGSPMDAQTIPILKTAGSGGSGGGGGPGGGDPKLVANLSIVPGVSPAPVAQPNAASLTGDQLLKNTLVAQKHLNAQTDATKAAQAKAANFKPSVRFGGFGIFEQGALADSGRFWSFGIYAEALLYHWGGSPADKQSDRDDARQKFMDELSHQTDNRGRILSEIDTLLQQAEYQNQIKPFTERLRPLAVHIAEAAKAEAQGKDIVSDETTPTIVDKVDAAMMQANHQAQAAEDQAKLLGRVPVASDDPALGPELSVEQAVKTLAETTKDPAFKNTVLTALAGVEKAEGQEQGTHRSLARRLVPGEMTARLYPNLKNPMSIGQRVFGILNVTPAWMRYSKAPAWKDQTDALTQIQGNLDKNVTATFQRVHWVLDFWVKARTDEKARTQDFETAVKAAEDVKQPAAVRAQALEDAIQAEADMEHARHAELLGKILLEDIGFSEADLDQPLASPDDISHLAGDKTSEMTTAYVNEYLTKQTQEYNDWLKHTFKHNDPTMDAERKTYMAAVNKLAGTAKQPLDWAALAKTPIADTASTTPGAPADGDTEPAFNNGDAPQSFDTPDIPRPFDLQDPSAGWLKGIHDVKLNDNTPLLSTPDSEVIGHGWTVSAGVNILIPRNAGKVKEAQKAYNAAASNVQDQVDAERQNESLYRQAKASLQEASVSNGLTNLQTEIASPGSRTETLKSGATKTLAIDPDTHLPLGFKPEAMLDRDIQQHVLVDAIKNLDANQLKNLIPPGAAGGQYNRNALFFWYEPDMSGPVVKAFKGLAHLIHHGSSKEGPEAAALVAEMTHIQTEQNIQTIKDNQTSAQALLKTTQDAEDAANRRFEEAKTMTLIPALSAQEKQQAENEAKAAHDALDQAVQVVSETRLYAAVVDSRYHVYEMLFEKDPQSDEFKSFFFPDPKNPPTKDTLAAYKTFRKDFSGAWEGSPTEKSPDKRLHAIQVALAGLTKDPTVPVISGLSGGPFVAATVIPPTATIDPAPVFLTAGGRTGFTMNLRGHSTFDKTAEPAVAKDEELKAAEADAQAKQAAAAPLVGASLEAKAEIADVQKQMDAVIAKAKARGKLFDKDISAAAVLRDALLAAQSAEESQHLSDQMAVGVDASEVTSIDKPFNVLYIAHPEEFAKTVKAKAAKDRDFSASNGVPLTVAAFGQEGIQNNKEVGKSFGGRLTIPIPDPRQKGLNKKANAASDALKKETASLKAAEDTRQWVNLAKEVNRLGEEYASSQARYSHARSNYQAMLAYVDDDVMDPMDLIGVAREYVSAIQELAPKAAALRSKDIALLQRVDVNPVLLADALPSTDDKVVAAKASATSLGIEARAIAAPEAVAPAVAVDAKVAEHRREYRAYTRTVTQGTADPAVMADLEAWMIRVDHAMDLKQWRRLVELSKVVDVFTPTPDDPQSAEHAFFMNMNCAMFFVKGLFDLDDKTKRYDIIATSVLAAVTDGRPERAALFDFMGKVHDNLHWGPELVGDQWNSEVRKDWMLWETKLMLHGQWKDLPAALKTLEDPMVRPAIQALAALYPKNNLSSVIRTVAEAEAAQLSRGVKDTPNTIVARLTMAALLTKNMAAKVPLNTNVDLLTAALESANRWLPANTNDPAPFLAAFEKDSQRWTPPAPARARPSKTAVPAADPYKLLDGWVGAVSTQVTHDLHISPKKQVSQAKPKKAAPLPKAVVSPGVQQSPIIPAHTPKPLARTLGLIPLNAGLGGNSFIAAMLLSAWFLIIQKPRIFQTVGASVAAFWQTMGRRFTRHVLNPMEELYATSA